MLDGGGRPQRGCTVNRWLHFTLQALPCPDEHALLPRCYQARSTAHTRLLKRFCAGRTSVRGAAACSWQWTSRRVRARHRLWLDAHTMCWLCFLQQCGRWPLHTSIFGANLCIDSCFPLQPTTTVPCTTCCTRTPTPCTHTYDDETSHCPPPTQPTTTAPCTTCCLRAW